MTTQPTQPMKHYTARQLNTQADKKMQNTSRHEPYSGEEADAEIAASTQPNATRPAEVTQMTANRNYPNTGGWQDRHDEAVSSPKVGFERAIAQMLKGWQEYAHTVKRRYESQIGKDYVLGPEWEAIGKGIEGLLNGELGRLDAGTLDSFIRGTLKDNGCEVED